MLHTLKFPQLRDKTLKFLVQLNFVFLWGSSELVSHFRSKVLLNKGLRLTLKSSTINRAAKLWENPQNFPALGLLFVDQSTFPSLYSICGDGREGERSKPRSTMIRQGRRPIAPTSLPSFQKLGGLKQGPDVVHLYFQRKRKRTGKTPICERSSFDDTRRLWIRSTADISQLGQQLRHPIGCE